MASDPSSGMGGFFPGMLEDLMKMMRTNAPLQWDFAVQMAQTIAADGAVEDNVEPADRIRLEQLIEIAKLHVADVTGMAISPLGRPITVLATGRSDWARRSLDAWRPVIESVASALTPQPGDVVAVSDDQGDDAGVSDFLSTWTTAVAPAMIAMQVGSVLGHLAQRTLGQYELPLPRPTSDEIVVVPANGRAFAEDWSISPDDVTLWTLARDLTFHAIYSREHVANRLTTLLSERAKGFRPDPHALEERLGGASPSDISDINDLSRLLGDPSALGELIDTPELARIRAELAALNAAIQGYAQWAAMTVLERTSGSKAALKEAIRRRRIARSDEERAGDALFGLDLDQEALDRGESFVTGVLERRGEAELAKLWVVEENLPTPSEVDAPGLWIERVNLPRESS